MYYNIYHFDYTFDSQLTPYPMKTKKQTPKPKPASTPESLSTQSKPPKFKAGADLTSKVK